MDRPTGQIIRRCERSRPGEPVHVDIKKLANIPDGGGHRIMPRQQAAGNRQATTDARRGGSPVIGCSYVHTAVDDHSRLAYSEVLTDERKETTASFWQRANTFFAEHGINVERVLTDNGSCYRSRLFGQTLSAAGIVHKRTRPYRPQTNGKVERLNRTLLDEWAYVRPYPSNAERTEALTDFLHTYTYHRCHTALDGQPPISRVNNPAGQYRPRRPRLPGRLRTGRAHHGRVRRRPAAAVHAAAPPTRDGPSRAARALRAARRACRRSRRSLLAVLLGCERTPLRCTHTWRVTHTSSTAQVATTVLATVLSTAGKANQAPAIAQKNATMA